MKADAFRNFYWGFFFILISFRIQGFDIFPDIIGFILLSSGAGKLASENEYFSTAEGYTVPMFILSLFSIYVRPPQEGGIQFAYHGPVGLLYFLFTDSYPPAGL